MILTRRGLGTCLQVEMTDDASLRYRLVLIVDYCMLATHSLRFRRSTILSFL